MNNINGFDEQAGIVDCDSGVILQHLSDYLSPYGYIAPLDLGAKGSFSSPHYYYYYYDQQ